MAEYIFDRGMFGRWGVPMWAGETQAFKLIRLLKKQGVTGIKYEEGPLEDYTYRSVALPYTWLNPRQYKDADRVAQQMEACLNGQAPQYFMVTF
jgi:hypothetical protein